MGRQTGIDKVLSIWSGKNNPPWIFTVIDKWVEWRLQRQVASWRGEERQSYLYSSPPTGLQGPGAGEDEGTGLGNLTLDSEIVQSQVGGRGVGRHLSSGS